MATIIREMKALGGKMTGTTLDGCYFGEVALVVYRCCDDYESGFILYVQNVAMEF